jgi:hypothetical protein
LIVGAAVNAVSNHLGAPLQQGKNCEGGQKTFLWGVVNGQYGRQLVLIPLWHLTAFFSN